MFFGNFVLKIFAHSKKKVSISNARLKLPKNDAKKKADAKQHPEVELLLFENYSHS